MFIVEFKENIFSMYFYGLHKENIENKTTILETYRSAVNQSVK